MGILHSTSFNLPIICVGNLSVGGTGKTPMVIYLSAFLKDQFRIAILSRGYKRKTAGYALAHPGITALEIGDEPKLFHSKFPDIPVAVGEQRLVAIPQLLHDRPDTEVILLDDAFQHRAVKAGMNILLTEYGNLYTHDWFLPTGELRDERSGASRARVIMVTKCPPTLSTEERKAIIRQLNPAEQQEVFFTGIEYGVPYHILTGEKYPLDDALEVLLISGIANPKPLKNYLIETVGTYEEILFSDHHIFTIDDWKEISKKYEQLDTENKIVLTTEKDAVRLIKFSDKLKNFPLYVIPIQVKFFCDRERDFQNLVTTFITTFRQKTNTNAKETAEEKANKFPV